MAPIRNRCGHGGALCLAFIALMNLSSAWVNYWPARRKTASAWSRSTQSTPRKDVEATYRTPVVVSSSGELRREIIDMGRELKEVQVEVTPQNFTAEALFGHKVMQLILRRAKEGSKPGHRPSNDTSILALAVEGGGMRGAVGAGMCAALACLGLTDSFDKVYGSSAGSVVGAYLVSRQLCMDVYLDILPAAKTKFMCLRRLSFSICMNALDTAYSVLFRRAPPKPFSNKSQPAMNISFVLDDIMHPEQGMRPLDLASFLKNDVKQPLRVVSSCSERGRLVSSCFGRNDYLAAEGPSNRNGIYACLQASMTVPGATGPPVRVTNVQNQTKSYFDAFCCEPVPYRSAIEEGATHCLVLCSRPDGFCPQTRPTLYEMGVAPIYFLAHGEGSVAKFFARGGQQYLYAEDLLTLQDGLLDRGKGVCVPPTTLLYGVDRDVEAEFLAHNRSHWQRAHLLPLKVPFGTAELATIEQEQLYVIELGIRAGFAAAYDAFAPALDLDICRKLSGHDVARIIFPYSVKPAPLVGKTWNSILPRQLMHMLRDAEHDNSRMVRLASGEVKKVLESLPGLRSGSFDHFLKSVLGAHGIV